MLYFCVLQAFSKGKADSHMLVIVGAVDLQLSVALYVLGSMDSVCLHTGCNWEEAGATLEPDLLLNSTFAVGYVANNSVWKSPAMAWPPGCCVTLSNDPQGYKDHRGTLNGCEFAMCVEVGYVTGALLPYK